MITKILRIFTILRELDDIEKRVDELYTRSLIHAQEFQKIKHKFELLEKQ